MEFIATQKFVRMSPKKIRLLLPVIKKTTPMQAIDVLPFMGKIASQPLEKVIKTAIANAKQKGVDQSQLIFKEIQIGEAPRLKRGRPVSRGRWHPYKRRMSHIRVVLETVEPKAVAKKVAAKNDRKTTKATSQAANTKATTKEDIKQKKVAAPKKIKKGDK